MLQLGLSSSAQAGSCLPLLKSPTLPKLLSLPDLSYIALLVPSALVSPVSSLSLSGFCHAFTHIVLGAWNVLGA